VTLDQRNVCTWS